MKFKYPYPPKAKYPNCTKCHRTWEYHVMNEDYSCEYVEPYNYMNDCYEDSYERNF